MTTLASLPEELLERILVHTDTRSRMAPLLVCRAFDRIALPFFYHTLVLHSSRQSAALLVALRAQPDLARGVRVLVLPSPSASDAAVLSMLPKLLREDADDLTRAVRDLRTLQELSVRKAAGTYLSQPAPRAMLDALSSAVLASPQLVAANPALARVCLGDAASPAAPSLAECGNRRATFTSFSGPAYQPRPILPTALFLRAARPHARLSELIRAGHAPRGGYGIEEVSKLEEDADVKYYT
ncbi:hypothetical protein B0H14DRAFT_2683419 [Mycena olivaceomarginata]|nr:hypothetical protein B0H14DRAFT_2683419 [Mycena olivaceomarginata]